jgi:hypothetical protein
MIIPAKEMQRRRGRAIYSSLGLEGYSKPSLVLERDYEFGQQRICSLENRSAKDQVLRLAAAGAAELQRANAK